MHPSEDHVNLVYISHIVHIFLQVNVVTLLVFILLNIFTTLLLFNIGFKAAAHFYSNITIRFHVVVLLLWLLP